MGEGMKVGKLCKEAKGKSTAMRNKNSRISITLLPENSLWFLMWMWNLNSDQNNLRGRETQDTYLEAPRITYVWM